MIDRWLSCQTILQSLQCIDLMTGELIWKEKREDAQYVACIDDGVVVIVGDRHTCGRSLSTGELQWQTPLGLPSGRGVRTGSQYLVPLKSGRVASIEIATGEQVGLSTVAAVALPDSPDNNWDEVHSDETRQRPGNLIAHGELILSVGPNQVAAYPQAEAILSQLREKATRAEETAGDLLQAAELELALGRFTDAETHLQRLLERKLDQQEQLQGRRLRQLLLYDQLDRPAGNTAEILAELEVLAGTPLEQGRLLIRKTKWQLQQEEIEGLLESLDQFATLELNALLPASDQSSLLVTPSSWIPLTLDQIERRYPNTYSDRIAEHIERQLLASLQSNSREARQKVLHTYCRGLHNDVADKIRRELASELMATGDFQQAELLLLECRKRGSESAAATATQLLVEMWSQLGLHQEAASLLTEFEQRFAKAILADGRTGREYLAAYPSESLTRRAYQRFQLPNASVARVAIKDHRWIGSDTTIAESYRGRRIRFHTPDDSSYHLINHGGRNSASANNVSLIDQQTGVIAGELRLPKTYKYPVWMRYKPGWAFYTDRWSGGDAGLLAGSSGRRSAGLES